MASSPPLPPSPSLDDLLIPPIPPIIYVPECGDLSPDDASLDIFPKIFPPIEPPSPLAYVPPIPAQVQSPPVPIEFFFPPGMMPDKCYVRGRSRSRSRSPPSSRGHSASPVGRRHSPIRACGGPIYIAPPSLYYPGSSLSRSCSPDSSRSPSPVPPPRRKRYSYRSRTPSPMRPYTYSPPQIIYPPPAPPIVTVPSMTPPPPIRPFVYRQETLPIAEPVDILTYHYNKNMAYAPAAKTYDVCFSFFSFFALSPPCHATTCFVLFCCVVVHVKLTCNATFLQEAMDNVLELWPDLRDIDRDHIHLFVGGADQLVRVPKMAWNLVMCDLPRYEIMHVQVDQLPPPPQYQSDGKGNWASGDEKKQKKQTARSGGFFSSIKRIFWR